MHTLSRREIAERLDDRFSLLTGGSRDVPARQQTLLATVDWSHDLLRPSERALFRRLSVFAGGWLLTDAEHVCAGTDLPAQQVCDVLSGLVAKSLAVAEPVAGDATRYRMLETLRDYARSRLILAGEQEAVRRHFSYFLALAERAHEQKLASGSDAGMTGLASQLENLRAGSVFARAADARGCAAGHGDGAAAAGGQPWRRTALANRSARTGGTADARARASTAGSCVASQPPAGPRRGAQAGQGEPGAVIKPE